MAQEVIEDQIKMLEAQLEAKRRKLSNQRETKEGHEVIREVFKEIAQNPPALPIPSVALPSTTDDTAAVTALQEKEHEAIIEELVSFALSKDLFAALKRANSLKNPHLIDEFHDKLARHYDTLLQARKVKL